MALPKRMVCNSLHFLISDIADFINNTQWVKVFPPKEQPNISGNEWKTEGQRLAQFSELVHQSSLKRFLQVAKADRGWRPSTNQLSFVDILKG